MNEELKTEILVFHKKHDHKCAIEQIKENCQWGCNNEYCTCCDFGIYFTDLNIHLEEKQYGWYCPVCLENLKEQLGPPRFPKHD